MSGEEGFIIERGPDGERKLPILHLLGGKNIYYFLTPWERGRLQTLPLAYDLNSKRWFDTAGSGVRHFPDMEDSPLHWTDRPYTFNTSCYGCHVSQLTTNYDSGSDAYHTTWAEAGINCETCHGPSGEHVRFCQEDEEACKDDVRLIKTSVFNVEQTNTMCAPCHAKMVPLGNDFMPGDRYFDHYDLVTLEDRDFYPDGRDLGENYTHTLWMMSPCVKSGQLDCMHCHTSSGRYRFHGENANDSCAPCHQDHVDNAPAHTHHEAGTDGNKCISCHMPMTTFAHMHRSDHSMRPPAPAATREFTSPNACNICHDDKDADWADQWVRKWRKRDYQKPIIYLGKLLDAARKDDWSRLDEIIAYLGREDRDEIYATSFVRVMRNCEDERKWPALIRATKDPSPLVRAAAADALSNYSEPDAVAALIEATRDDYRLVRIRAAASLARIPLTSLNARDRASIEKATTEFLGTMRARPDDGASHTNLANFHMNQGNLRMALESFESAIRVAPESVATLVNAALAYNLNGQNDKAEECLRQAVQEEPANPAANFNLGLLLGELGNTDEAKNALRTALKAEPDMAAAAYNLCVLEAQDNHIERALTYCAQAAEHGANEPKYGYTLAFYQMQSGRADEAVRGLSDVIAQHPAYLDAYMLLGEIHRRSGNAAEAARVMQMARQVQEQAAARAHPIRTGRP